MAGNALRRVASAVAVVFLTTLLAGVPGSGAQVVDPDTNPALQQSCGLNIVLVLDRSSSIATANAGGTLKSAANAFLAGLNNTGSKVALVSFGTTATVNTVPGAPVSITTATLPALQTIVNGLVISTSPTAYTNWDDGLAKANSQLASFGTGPKPLVVVITDGSPNRWINDTSPFGVGSGSDSTAVAQAVDEARRIKDNGAGSRIFALGVGTLNIGNLQAISGSAEYPGASFVNADWARITSFSDLQATLTQIATDLCKESVVVHKMIGGVAASGWTFTATSTSPTQTDTTEADGIANFGWSSVDAINVTITETAKPGYTLQGVVCNKVDAQGAIIGAVTKTSVPNGASFSVGPQDKIDCTFTNNRTLGDLTIHKTIVGATTGTFLFDVNCDDGTAHDRLGDNPVSITGSTSASITGIPTGTSCAVTERANPLFTSGLNPQSAVIDANGETLTFTNTRKTGSLTVTKDVQGGSGTFDFTVDCDGLEPTNHSITGDGQFIVEGIPTETSCTVEEAPDSLWNSSVLPADGTVTIHSGDSAVVAFLNSAKPDGITIDKKVNGADHASLGDALLAHVGDTLTYTVVVTNNGQVPLQISALSDSLAPNFATACPHIDSILDPDDSFTCTYTVTAASDAHNLVSVTGTDDLDRSVTASDSTYVDVIHPGVSIVKTASPTNPNVGDVVTFSYVVTNTGDALLTNLTVNDDILGSVGTIASLAPGASTTLTKTMVAAAASPTKNVGTIKGSDPLGLEIKASDDATITVVLPQVLEVAKAPEVLGIELVAPAPAAPVVAPATLPRTGNDPSRLLLLGWIALLAGLASLAGAKLRRRNTDLG